MHINSPNQQTQLKAMVKYQLQLIRKHPKLIITPTVAGLVKFSLIFLIAHPIISHFNSVKNLTVFSSAYLFMCLLLIAYCCSKNLLEAVAATVSVRQLSDIIIGKNQPRGILKSIRSIKSQWKNIISWALFLTFFSRFFALGRRWLYQWRYFIDLTGNTNCVCSSFLIIPCIVLEKTNARNAYRTVGKRINAIWGETPRLNLTYLAATLLILLITLTPSIIYFLSGTHQIAIMIICVGFTLVANFIVSSFSKLNRDITMVLLYEFTTSRKNMSKEIDAEKFFISQKPGMVNTLNTNQATAVTA